MSTCLKLERTLQAIAEGAAAVNYAGRAVAAGAGMLLHPEFTHNALTLPLQALSDLLGADLPPLPEEPPQPPRARRSRPRRKKAKAASTKVVAKGLPVPVDLGGFDARVSSWDPDEAPWRPYSPDSDPLLEAGACRALLLEIIRRAAFDWVLYRQSSKLQNRQLAESAYTWLFQENEESSSWTQRTRSGKTLTGFVAICEVLDIDPERTRARVRLLTQRDIMAAGRPAERRRHKQSTDEVLLTDDLRVFDVNVDALPSFDPMFASKGG